MENSKHVPESEDVVIERNAHYAWVESARSLAAAIGAAGAFSVGIQNPKLAPGAVVIGLASGAYAAAKGFRARQDFAWVQIRREVADMPEVEFDPDPGLDF